jgi:hypothetical protein
VLTTVGALSPAPGRYALGPVPEWVGGLLIAWSFLVGFRGILLHQVDDYLADRRAGTKTAITPRTRILAVSFIIMVCLPAEIGLVVALIVSLSSAVSYFAAYAGVSFTLLGIRAAREAVRRRRDDPSLADWRLDDDLGVGAWLESSPGGGLAVRTGRERTGEAWMLRLRTRAVVIPPGQPHRLYLRARSDRRRPFELAVTETREPWTRLGPYESRELDTEWGRVRIDLPATDQSVEVCAQLNLGTGVGPVELTDVALVRVGDSANLLEDDQALAPDPYDRARAYRRRRFADYIGAWVLNDFYEKWLPLFPLVALTVREPWYAVVAGAHLILFRSALPRP